MISADSRIPEHIANLMRETISQALKREVLFVCTQDEDGMLASARPVARGNEGMVPAPELHMREGQVIVHNHPSGTLNPSDADVSVAARLAAQGIGSWIVDGSIEKLYVITEAYQEQEKSALDLRHLADMLLPGGGLSKLQSDFEPRDPQLEMLEEVVKAFNENLIVVSEAGTGVGKSLAYLIPAAAWVLQNRERVVVSTATINLQQQILEKDIPTVRRLFQNAGGDEIKVVLAKGRNQYLCQSRLQELIDEEGLFGEEQLDEIRRWAEVTETGDRSDLPFNPEPSLWARVNSDADACSELRCSRRGSCFLQKARKAAASAHIVVTNHHLLFADLAIRKEGFGQDATVILPAFQRLIIDEAHNVEGAATSYFSEEFNRFTLHKYANMLLRQRRSRSGGIVPALRKSAGSSFQGAEALIQTMRSRVQELDDALLPFLDQQSSLRLAADPNELPGSHVNSELETVLFEQLGRFQQSVLDAVELLSDEFKHLDDSDNDDPRIAELRIMIRRLEGVAKICGDFREYATRPDLVYWLDRRRSSAGDRFVHFTATPIEVGPLLKEAMFDQYESIVLTSATLSVNKSIQYWQRRVGLLNNNRLVFKSMESPFDYGGRVLLGVPNDAPSPSSGEQYSSWLKGFVMRMLDISEGHALILFTSYAMLTEVYDYCKPLLVQRGITCFRQGDDDRNRLMSSFQKEVSSVLFATHSFWEGIDAPGDALKLLIISRLPFRVPTEPVLLARTDAIQSRGGNPFFELSLPEAVMKLKQGFGRLMRRKSDRGVVLITDNRVITKRYGRNFIDSLPPARLVVESSERLAGEVERVLYEDPDS